jgi:hypothetical protein
MNNQKIQSRIEKTNEQRISMAIALVKILKGYDGQVPLNVRAHIAGAMLGMIHTSMIPEDTYLIETLNEAIDSVCDDAKMELGISDLRFQLTNIVSDIENEIQKEERISTGDSILQSLNLNNINLN